MKESLSIGIALANLATDILLSQVWYTILLDVVKHL